MFRHLFEYFFVLFKSLSVFGVFLSMFIENIGIPLPTEIGYLIAHDLVASGRYSYLLILLVLVAGHVIGSTVSYLFGVWGEKYIHNKLKGDNKLRGVQEKLNSWYSKYGDVTVFLARFVGYVRPWSSFVAGLAEVPFGIFLFWTTLGSLIFNILNLYLAKIFMAIWWRYEVYHFWIILIAFLFFFGGIIYSLINKVYSKKSQQS